MRRTHGTHARARARWLELFDTLGTVAAACRCLGVARSTVYRWRAADLAFAERWDDISEEWADRLEAEAYRRAMHGVERPVVRDGRVVGTETVRSDRLLMVLLEARRPEVYRESRARRGG